jgi:hypothetical protein
MAVFDDLLIRGIKRGHIPARTQEAKDWFRERARRVIVKPSVIMREEKASLRNRIAVGSMYMFRYDPKYKKTLPYYDRFPLVFPFDRTPNGFIGLNLHYLPPKLRAMLMDILYGFANNNKYNNKTRLMLEYSALKQAASTGLYGPCVKRYLRTHVRSQFLKVHPNQWDIALMLPVAQFKKESQRKVWADSRRKIAARNRV